MQFSTVRNVGFFTLAAFVVLDWLCGMPPNEKNDQKRNIIMYLSQSHASKRHSKITLAARSASNFKTISFYPSLNFLWIVNGFGAAKSNAHVTLLDI